MPRMSLGHTWISVEVPHLDLQECGFRGGFHDWHLQIDVGSGVESGGFPFSHVTFFLLLILGTVLSHSSIFETHSVV